MGDLTAGVFNLPPSPPESHGDSDGLSEKSGSGSSKGLTSRSSGRSTKSGSAMNPMKTKRSADEPKLKRSNKRIKGDDQCAPSEPEPVAGPSRLAHLTPVRNNQPAPVASPPSPASSDDSVYEVEVIEDFWREDGDDVYLIKWKNWSDDNNTWEGIENLSNCHRALKEFYLKRLKELKEALQAQGKSLAAILKTIPCPPDPRPMKDRIDNLLQVIKMARPPAKELEDIYKKSLKKNGKKKQEGEKWSDKKMEDFYLRAMLGVLEDSNLPSLKEHIVSKLVELKHEEVKNSLQRWESDLNSITQGMPKIKVENTVDFSGPPKDFTYVNEYVPIEGLKIPNDPPCGCECEESCQQNKKTCCGHTSVGRFAYTNTKKLNVPVGVPIYECNKACPCDETCINRVVQNGRSGLKDAHFCIFKTENKGWGVKTLKKIKKGEFVAIYAGEVIPNSEAERRGRKYDRVGVTYLFDLDLNKNENGDCKFTVDAKKIGNISHFFNHSCDPNLVVMNVLVDCLDVDMPLLSLFSTRDIAVGEELSFDYSKKSFDDEEDEDDDDEEPKGNGKYPCSCQSANCKGYMF